MAGDGLKRLSALLQEIALEYDAAGGSTGNADANSASVQGFCLSTAVLSELHEFFESYDPRSSKIAGLWEDLAEKSIPPGGIVRILSASMESKGLAGLMAANIYLHLLLVPGWPVYSLFSQMAFDSLARCLRNACKLSSKDWGGQGSAAVGNKGRKGQGKGKRVRENERQPRSDGEHDLGQERQDEATEIVSIEDVRSLLVKLQKIVLVLQLKERQDTLKLIVGLLVDMLHLLSDMKEDEGVRNEMLVREKKRAGAVPPRIAVPDIVLSTLGSLLGAVHGEPLKTAIMVLRALAPTILLSSGDGSGKVEIRIKTLQFVTHTLLTAGFISIRQAVVALPRYLCFKAPERTEGRSLAVESVLIILRASNSKEWCRFCDYLCKFSHSKPRHRLVAVDVALTLLSGLPNPLKQESSPDDLGSASPISSEEDQVVEPPKNRNEIQNPAHFKPNVESQLNIDEDLGAEDEDRDTPRGNFTRNGQKGASGCPPDSQWWGITCFEILLHRCSDKGAAIRSRSLTNLAQAIEFLSVDVSSRRLVQTLLGFHGNCSHGAGCSVIDPQSSLFSSYDTPVLGGGTPSPAPSSNLPTATPLTPGAGHRDIWSVLQRRCLDDKAAVRKATFLLMKKLTALLGKAPDEAILHAMGAACGDSLISIRKVALSALSEVMRRFPGDAKVTREWLKSALPLAFDNEQSLQDECLSLFEEIVLIKITLISTLNLSKISYSTTRETFVSQETQHKKDVERLLPVGALSLLKQMADGSSISSCVKRICASLGKKKRVRPGVALALQSLISAHGSPDGAWFLLSEITAFVPKAVGWEFLWTHWKLLDKKDNFSIGDEQQQPETSAWDKPYGNLATWAVNRVHLLQTISNVAIELPPDAAVELAAELLDRLKAFNMHPAEVGAHIEALAILCRRKALTPEEGNQLVIHWAEDLLGQAGNILQDSLSPSFQATTAADDVFQTPKPSNASSCVIGLTRSKNNKGENEPTWKQNNSPPQIVSVIFTVGALALACPDVKAGQVVTLLQTLLTRASGLLGHRKGRGADRILLKANVTPEINVHVRVALGKLCLADDSLAKRCVPLFAQELGRSDLAAVRNNNMIIMTDFCVRYTALTDGYIHDLTRSLRDPCELVRRQAFVLLSRLLQRDYVKWRGVFFHRFLLALVDDSEKITQLARYVFGSILQSKAPLLAYNSFVEAMFVLNDCVSQSSSSSLLQIPENERTLFCLRGDAEDVVEKRMKIYSILLQQMVPEHLLATSAKLCAEILAAAADNLLDLSDGPSQSVLKDALRILASKELRITGARASAGNAYLEEDDGGAAAAIAAVKGRVVTQLMKKNLVQNAVPIFIELKRLLESRNSPLLGLLMDCMRAMLKDYKNEIEEILVADKQLQKEILYDMQKYDAAIARAKVAAALPIQREVVQQVSPDVTHTPAPSVPLCATGSQSSKESRDQNIADNEAQRQAKWTTGGKENENPCMNPPTLQPVSRTTRQGASKGPGILTRTPVFSSLKKAGAGNFRAGTSSRVSWQTQQTPRIKICTAMPSSLVRLQSSESNKTPLGLAHPHCSRFGTPRRAAEDPSHPSRDWHEETTLAGAVADVAAASTVATVLQQVAQKCVTPFKAMSIPRLRPDISSTGFALNQQQPILQAESLKGDRSSQPSSDGGDGLETVRRRQSFSSVDEPCGQLSRSSSD